MAGIQQFLPFILVIVVFYFLLMRPQQQKAKRHKELIKNVRRGDRVLTSGGLFGTVIKPISDAELQIEIAEGVRIRLLRTAVTDVLTKTEPVGGSSPARDKDAAKGADDDSAKEGAEGDDSPEGQAAPAAPPAPTGIAGVLSRFLGGK